LLLDLLGERPHHVEHRDHAHHAVLIVHDGRAVDLLLDEQAMRVDEARVGGHGHG
jgi:hypothetical protein